MSTRPVEDIKPWFDQLVAIVHGIGDKRIETGEDFEARSLGSLWDLRPTAVAKHRGMAFLPSSYHDYDAREHAAQRARGQFVVLVGDVDKGQHPIEAIEAAVRQITGDAAYLIFSTPHSCPANLRWRILIPLDAPKGFAEWRDAQEALCEVMARQGIEMDSVTERAGQIAFLPNVPTSHEGEALRNADGPLYFQRAATSIDCPGISLGAQPLAGAIADRIRRRAEDDALRAKMRDEAQRRREQAGPSDGEGVVETFNRTADLATMLRGYGYKQSPKNSDDWRSPHQTSDSYATRIMGNSWVSLSGTDSALGIGPRHDAGCYGDAYDLFVFYDHGGNKKSAWKQACEEQGRSRPSNVIYLPQPPEWMNEAPGYDEMPDWGGLEAELDIEPAEPALLDPKAKPSLPFFWFNEAEPNLDANDFVEGLLTSAAMSVIYGPSNCGKTFFVVDMALHVAWGREWRGRAVDRGAVVYLSLEGAQGIRNRLAAFRKHHGLDQTDLPFIAMPKPVNLLNEDADVNAVIALVLHVAEVTGLHVAMVIVDTLSRAMAGGNENSPEDMTAIVGNCDRIRDATGAHVCIVHHSGKDEARGARGHSSLRAATDTEIEIKRDPELTVSSVRVAKQRDLEAGDPFSFSLHKIALGTNRRGKDVTSCVVVEAEQSVVLARDPNKLSPKEKQALSSLQGCLTAGGFETETDQGEPVRAVTLHAWKRSLQAFNVIDRDNDNTARPQFHRIKKALSEKGHIVIGGDYVWTTEND